MGHNLNRFSYYSRYGKYLENRNVYTKLLQIGSLMVNLVSMWSLIRVTREHYHSMDKVDRLLISSRDNSKYFEHHNNMH